jgi:GAF domain-containing protein
MGDGSRVGEPLSDIYLRRLEALNELATAVNSTLEVREVCQRALERTRDFFPTARWFCLRLLSHDGQQLETWAHVGCDAEHLRRWPSLKLTDDFAAARAVRERTTLHNWNIAESQVPAGTFEMAEHFGIRAYLVLPLIHRGEPLGSLFIAWPEPLALCADELEFCRNVGLQLACALANARLYEGQVQDRQRLVAVNQTLAHHNTRQADIVRGREREIEALFRLSSHISGTLDEYKVTTNAIDYCLGLTGSQFGFLVLLNPSGQIKIACVRGLAEEACRELRGCLESPEYQAVYEGVVLGNDTVCWNEPDARLDSLPPAPVPLHSLLCVPLLCAGRLTGAIGLANKPSDFDDEDLRLVTLFANQVGVAVQNARMYTRIEHSLQHRRRELTSLSRAVQELSGAQDEQTVYDRVIEIIREAFRSHFTWLMVCDPATCSLAVRTFRGEGEGCFGAVSHPLNEGVVGEVVRTGRPRFVEDVTAEPRFLFHEEAVRLGIRSVLYVPLVVQEETIGVVGICAEQFSERRPPRNQDLDLLLTFASIAGVAIENMRLAAQERQRTAREQLLNRITAEVRESMDTGDVLARAVQQLGVALGTSRCLALLVREDGQYQEFAHTVPGCEVDFADILWDACPIVRQVEEKRTAMVLKEVEPEQVCDAGFDPLPRSLLAIPAVRQNRLVGMFLFHQCDRERSWSAGDIDLAQRVVDQVATAVENARLYRQAVANGQFQHTLVETAAAIGSSVALTDVLQAICTHGQRLLGADGVYVWQVDEATRELVGKGAIGHKAERFLGLRMAMTRRGGLAVQAIQERRVIRGHGSADPAASQRLSRLFDAHAMLVVPIVTGDQVIGAVVFTTTSDERQFSEAHAKRAEILVSQAAAAVANAQLYEETLRRARELEVLWSIGQEMTENLDAEAVLKSIMSGSLQILDVDACSLMLLTSGQQCLTVSASHGLSEAHVQAAVFPTGRRIPRCLATDGQPRVTASLAADRDYPAQAGEDGLRSMLSVPMFDGDRMLGVLNVYSRRRRQFRIAEAQTLATLASFASVALRNAHAFEREHHIADTFQRSLKPDVSVRLEGIEIAQGYFAAMDEESDVGGDFYDLIAMDDNRLALVIGDVSGKGLDAAQHAAMIKLVLRGFATESPEPAALLARVNRVLCQTSQREGFVSLFYGVLDVERREITYANAGHELPVVLRRGEEEVELLRTTGPVLGLEDEAHYHEAHAQMAPGDTLVLYTDGFTEARRGSEFLQVEGLATFLARVRDESATAMADTVYHDVRNYAGGTLHDDATILVVKSLEAAAPPAA